MNISLFSSRLSSLLKKYDAPLRYRVHIKVSLNGLQPEGVNVVTKAGKTQPTFSKRHAHDDSLGYPMLTIPNAVQQLPLHISQKIIWNTFARKLEQQL